MDVVVCRQQTDAFAGSNGPDISQVEYP